MALQFYIGNSGSGKSYQMYQKVIQEAEKHPKKRYVVLVPEQFTMQTQRELVLMHPRHGIMNIDVLSFQRLAYRILDELGANRLPVLDETGKTFVVRKAAEQKKEQLLVLKSGLNRLGFVEEIKSFLSELIQYDISPDKMDGMMVQHPKGSRLRTKLEDLQCIYREFRSYLRDSYIMTEELPELLSREMDKSRWLRECTFVLDGFTGFTPLQKKVLEKMLMYAENVIVAVTTDSSLSYKNILPEYHLFHMSSRMIQDMEQMAIKNQLPVLKPVICGKTFRFQEGSPLHAMEQNLFRGRIIPYEKEQDEVSVHFCKNPLEEVKFAAEEIRRLVMNRGYRYSDVAVVVSDVNTYIKYAERVFGHYEIPCFVDHKKSIMENPVVEFIRALMELATKNFSYDAVMRFLRSGLTNLKQESVDEIDNYLLASGIKGKKKWSSSWEAQTGYLEEEAIEQLNQNRLQLMEELEAFLDVFVKKTTTVLQKTRELCKLFETYKIQQKLKQFEENFLLVNNQSMAKEYAQVYRIVIQTLDKLVELLGQEKTDAKEYAGLVEAGFSGVKVGVIPQGIDQVIVGDIERSRLKQVKALFFLGVNDGFVPKNISDAGIVSGLEREQLKEQGAELAPGSQEQYYMQRFHLYLNLTRLEERLYLCYSKNDSQGSTQTPSYLIGHIREILPQIELIDEEVKRKEPSSILTYRRGLEYLVENWNRKDASFFALYQTLNQKEEYKNQLEMLRHASTDGKRKEGMDAAVAAVLYKGALEGSVTRLERYAACAYGHFLQYGLMLRERDRYGFEGLDFGNILHEILQRYAESVRKMGLQWANMTQEKQKELAEQCLEETVNSFGNILLFQTARDKYRLERIRRIATRTIWALTKQLAAGKFEPEQAEVSFFSTREIISRLGEAAQINLRGRIDRTDVYEKDDKLYVKVVDYKTGQQDFKLLKVFYGLQLQLAVYLGEAVRHQERENKGKEVIPAGLVYYRIDDPLIEGERKDTTEEIEKQLLRKLCVDGMVLENREVLAGMDQEIGEALEKKEQLTSDVIPVKLNRDGTYGKQSKTASDKELSLMLSYVNHKIDEMATGILSGNIAVKPYREGTHTACDYCAYHGICGFDTKSGDSYHELSKTEDGLLYEKMTQYCKNKEGRSDGSAVDRGSEKSN